MKKISAEHFWHAFFDVWSNRLQSDTDERLLRTFSSSKAWTEFMLARDGLLDTIRKSLAQRVEKLEYQLGWYTVDALFVGGKNLFARGNYPAEVHVLIEHENQDDLQTEMWKLLHWRCPLKVLFFYDWTEEEKARSQSKAEWAERRIQDLREMWQELNQFWPEPIETEYLLIIGQRTSANAIVWRRELITEDVSRRDVSPSVQG